MKYRPHISATIRLALFGLVNWGASLLGHVFHYSAENVSTFWPSNGVILAALLLTSTRLWPIVVIIGIATQYASDIVLQGLTPVAWGGVESFLGSGVNALEVLAAAFLMRRFFGPTVQFSDLRWVLAFVAVATVLSCAVAGYAGAWAVSSLYPDTSFLSIWQVWSFADALGILLVTPAVVTWMQAFDRQGGITGLSRLGQIEALLLFTSTIVVAELVFSASPEPAQSLFDFPFVVFPFLMWAALRFDVRIVTSLLLGLGILIVGNAEHGTGPFVVPGQTAFEHVLSIQEFLFVVAMSTLIIATIVTQRRATVAELHANEEAMRASESRFKDFADSAADWYWEMDADFRFTYFSEACEARTGLSPDPALGRTRWELIGDEGEDAEKWQQHRRDLEARRPFRDFEYPVDAPDGTRHMLRVSGKPIFDAQDAFKGYRGAAQDVTEAHKLSATLIYQASHDDLTGLVNRRELEQRLVRVLKSVHEPNGEHAFCYLDLDQFKVVNDTCGHVAGDELLRQLVDLLKEKIRKRDTFARLGGDEFAVLLEHCTLVQARRVAEELRKCVEDFRFSWQGKRFSLSVSIGLAPVNEGIDSVSTLLSIADAVCYAAKDEGRNRVRVYHPKDMELARRDGEMRWVSQIHAALESDRFVLARQPIQAVKGVQNGKIYELLLRMVDEEGNIVPPGAFLPAAERYNLSVKLDRWVVSAAFGWLERHPRELKDLQLCFINLSSQSLGEDELLQVVTKSLQKGPVPAKKICFEVTETAAISNLTAASRFMAMLRYQGCRFALDDFGSGFSSFAYLKTLDVDHLKIDGMFAKDIVENPIDWAMVRSINEVSQVLGKQTIAESVEDHAILEELREIGVDYAQGYGIARPELLSDCMPRSNRVVKPASA